jgi:hypothetical protein
VNRDTKIETLCRRPRQHLGVTVARLLKRATTLLAGIRAGETTSIAFPSMCSKRSVAEMEAEFQRFYAYLIRSLTVAGAAQVKQMAT